MEADKDGDRNSFHEACPNESSESSSWSHRPQQPPEKLKQGITSPKTTSIKLTGVRKDLERPEASHNFYFDTFKELSLLGFNPS